MDIEKKVLDALSSSNEPLKAGQIAEMIGESKDDVNKVIKKLKENGKITSPKRCFYSLN